MKPITDEERFLQELWTNNNKTNQEIYLRIVRLQTKRLKTPEQEERLKDE